jgi:hypothetical protein
MLPPLHISTHVGATRRRELQGGSSVGEIAIDDKWWEQRVTYGKKFNTKVMRRLAKYPDWKIWRNNLDASRRDDGVILDGKLYPDELVEKVLEEVTNEMKETFGEDHTSIPPLVPLCGHSPCGEVCAAPWGRSLSVGEVAARGVRPELGVFGDERKMAESQKRQMRYAAEFNRRVTEKLRSTREWQPWRQNVHDRIVRHAPLDEGLYPADLVDEVLDEVSRSMRREFPPG